MIIGNLTRDPEMRTIPSGAAVCNFDVATNLVWKDASGQRKEKAEFHHVVVWRKLAEICGQYLIKGKKVYLEGRLQTREWLGQDGIRRYRTEIIANNMIMLNYGSVQAAGSGVPANNFNQAQSGPAARSVTPVFEGQNAASKPVIESLPSVSLEEPANSISPATPSENPENSMDEAMPNAAVSAATEANKEEEIKVEDIPF